MINITPYTWCLRAYGGRLRLCVSTAPGYAPDLAERLLKLGVMCGADGRSTVRAGTPGAVLRGLELLGAGEPLLAVVREYVAEWRWAKWGARPDAGRAERLARLVGRALAFMPVGNKQVKPN